MKFLGSELPSFMPKKTIPFFVPRGRVFLGIKVFFIEANYSDDTQ